MKKKKKSVKMESLPFTPDVSAVKIFSIPVFLSMSVNVNLSFTEAKSSESTVVSMTELLLFV